MQLHVLVPFGTIADSVVLFGTNVKWGFMTGRSMLRRRLDDRDETAVRDRILEAAFAAFTKNGYAATSTLEIATRARVSKRELYALVGNKQEMLMACITERAKRFQVPADLPVPHDRESLAHLLASFGAARPRSQRSGGHRRIPTGDCGGGPCIRGGADARFHWARGGPCRLA